MPYWYLRLTIYIFLILSWCLFWFFKRNQLPETPEGKIGIVMAITTKDEKCKTRLEDDFISEFRKQIKESGLQNLFYVVQTKNYQAERLKPILEEQEAASDGSPKWIDIQKKIKGHLYIWGTLKERNQGKSNFVLDYSVLVGHGQFEERLKRELSSDIKQFWLQQFRIEETNEIEGFVDSAKQYYQVVKYLLGYAALYSGANEIAFVLHKSLEDDLNQRNDTNSVKLLSRTKHQLSTEHFIFAYLSAFQSKSLREIELHIKNCLVYNPENADAYIFKARLEFTHKGNPNSALQSVYLAKKYSLPDDWTWKYSEAFLKMYLGEYETALKIYDTIFKSSYVSEEFVLEQVLSFNLQQANKIPSLVESFFILGILTYKKNHNLPVALEYFDKFLKRVGKNKKYHLLKSEAKKYIKEIEGQMQLN